MGMMRSGETRAFSAEAILRLGETLEEAHAIIEDMAQLLEEGYFVSPQLKQRVTHWLDHYRATQEQEAAKD